MLLISGDDEGDGSHGDREIRLRGRRRCRQVRASRAFQSALVDDGSGDGAEGGEDGDEMTVLSISDKVASMCALMW